MKPSPPGPCGSAHRRVDVEQEPVSAGVVDEDCVENNKEVVLCGSNDTARETADKMRKLF